MIGLKEVGLDRLICGWQREWVWDKMIGKYQVGSTAWPMRFEMCVVLINRSGCSRARSGNGAASCRRG